MFGVVPPTVVSSKVVRNLLGMMLSVSVLRSLRGDADISPQYPLDERGNVVSDVRSRTLLAPNI